MTIFDDVLRNIDTENVPVVRRGRGRGSGRGKRADRLGRDIVQGRGVDTDQTPMAQDLEWSRCNLHFEKDDNISVPEFTEVEGVTVRVPDNPTALDFLNFYLTDELFQLMVDETNRYADQYFHDHPESADSTSLQEWEPLSLREMKTFIALVILMGIVHTPTIPMYWSTDMLYSTPIFPNP